MKTYLVRHGEVNHNLLKKYSRENEDLNETGVKQAGELRRKIEHIEYDAIISSPLLRARHTADIINIKNKSVIVDERLRERDPGSLSGQPIESTNRDEYWGYYSKLQYGTSEGIVSFFDRVNHFLDMLKTQNYKSVIVVAHSGVSKAFYGYFNGIPEDGYFLHLGLKNCEVKEYNLPKVEENDGCE